MSKILTALQERAKRRKIEFMSHVDQWVIDRIATGKPIGLEEWQAMRVNSYEARLLRPLWTDEVLIHQIKYYQLQSSQRELREFEIPAHYDDALMRELLPMLLKRFETEVFEWGQQNEQP